MANILKLLLEATIVGIVFVCIGLAISFLLSLVIPFKEKYKYLGMTLGLFVTAFLAHLLFEAVGANKWYCKHGQACN